MAAEVSGEIGVEAMSIETKQPNALEILGGTVILLPVLVLFALPILLLWAWAFVNLWAWFIVPTFGVVTLTYPQAMGFALIRSITMRTSSVKSEHQESKWNQFGWSVFQVVFTVLLGWIVKSIWM